MKFSRRRTLGVLLSCAAVLPLSLPTLAVATDAWPSKVMKVVVPYPPGGSADLLGRLVAKTVSDALPDTRMVVENLAGGATVPAATSVLRDPADGHTLFMASDNTLNLNHWLLKNPRYDADNDFVPVTVLNTYPHWVIVNPEGKHKSFEDLVDYIRENPGKASISVNTVGGAAYLALDNWRRVNQFDFVIIPYRGSPPAVTDLIGGQTDAHLDVVGSSAQHARSGRVQPVAVLQSEPLKEFPQAVPQSYDDEKALTVRSNLSVVVRNGTPPEIIERLFQIIKEGVAKPEFVEALEMFNYSAVLTDPKTSREFVLSETQRYGKLVEQSGLEKQ